MRVGLDISPLCQSQWGGVHYYIDAVVQTLVEQYPDDELVLFGVMPRALKPRMAASSYDEYEQVTSRFIGLPARFFWPGVQWWQRLGWPSVESLGIELDVWHSFDWFSLPSTAPQTLFVFDVTPELFPEWHGSANRRVHEAFLKYGISRSEQVFVLSQATQRDVSQLFGISHDAMTVVYPGMRLPEVQPIESASLDLPEAYFLFVGTIEPRKNVGRLLEAYRALPAKIRQQYGLVIVGAWGWSTQDLRHRLDNSEGVVWLQEVSDEQLVQLYLGAQVFVFPSLYEGFGMPVLEAARFRVPVVTSQTSSMPEVLGAAAMYVDPTRVESMTAGMQRAVSLLEVERLQMVEEAFNRSKRFSWKATAAKLMSRWREIA